MEKKEIEKVARGKKMTHKETLECEQRIRMTL